MTVFDWRTAWAAVVVHPLFAVALTLIAFQLALMLYRRSGWLVLQPVMVGMLLVVGTLTLVDLDYARYRDGAALVAMLLGPATVALAVPLHRHLKRIQQLFWPIVITLAVGGVLSVVLTLAIAWALGAELPVLMSLAPKSATMPIAMLVAEQLGGLASLAAVFVMLTGVIGTALGPLLLRWAGVEHPAARGLSYGSSRFPGEGGLDFQEEVLRVPESIGHALDYLDAVVNTLKDAGMHVEVSTGKDASRVFAQVASEALQRREVALASMSQPGSPAPPALSYAGGVPDVLQRILEHIDRSQRLVGSKQLL